MFLGGRVPHSPQVGRSSWMSNGSEYPAEHLIDLGFEIAMLFLVGIPICLILLVLGFIFCLICLLFFVTVAPFLFLSYRRRDRAMRHTLSDWTLGVFEPVVET